MRSTSVQPLAKLSAVLACWLLQGPLPAQDVGGEYNSVFEWSGTVSYGGFGVSVAAAGDVDNDGTPDMIVGADGSSVGVGGVGRALVYSGSDGTLIWEWTSDGITTFASFGASVDGVGDVNGDGWDDVVVGDESAYFSASGRSGGVFVFSGADGSVLWTWEGQQFSRSFGHSVAGAGDVDQDGVPDVLVGAPQYHSGGVTNNGAVLVYSGANGSEIRRWDGVAMNDSLGETVSAAGDVDGDGAADVLVHAIHSTGGNWAAGAAYVYSGATSAVLHSWTGVEVEDQLGRALAAAGDVDGDGFDDLLVGAPGMDPGGQVSLGSAFLYSGATGAVVYRWDGWDFNDTLGASVASAGDVDGDAVPDVVVGLPGRWTARLDCCGSIYVYSGADGSILHNIDGRGDGDYFGNAVAGIGDVTGDGRSDLLVGADEASTGGSNDVGAAYVFDVYNRDPFLVANVSTVSAAAGGTLVLDLDFPDDVAFEPYFVLASGTGSGPTYDDIAVPLTIDSLTIDTFFGNWPVPSSNMQGVLDAAGQATGSLAIPGGLPQALIGRSYYLAAIALDSGGDPVYSSMGVSLEIVP